MIQHLTRVVNDPDATYGKPLPPSEGICYPRSSVDPNDLSLNNFSYGFVESPYEKGVDEPVEKPSNASKTDTPKDQEKQSQGSGGDGNVGSNGKPVDSYQGEENKENYPDGYSSWNGHGNGAIGDRATEYEKRVPQIPTGYGLEAMDHCESLFGYWPCLARAKRESDYRDCLGVCSKRSNDNRLWERTADYLFGNSYPYGE